MRQWPGFRVSTKPRCGGADHQKVSPMSAQYVSPASCPQDALQFHPLAAIFPLMEGAELGALTDDIRAHGLVEPIILPEGRILDGRNRYLACRGADVQPTYRPFEGVDPFAFVISANLHRRHLTRGQRHTLIEKLLQANPEQSDRQIAQQAKVDHKTVGTVRAEMQSTGEIPQLKKTVGADGKARRQPVKRTKAAKVGPCRRRGERGDHGHVDRHGRDSGRSSGAAGRDRRPGRRPGSLRPCP